MNLRFRSFEKSTKEVMPRGILAFLEIAPDGLCGEIAS